MRTGLFRDHLSGINPKIIEIFQLPTQDRRKKAIKLLVYFEERNDNAQYPGLFEEISESQLSFSARFGADNFGMQRIRREILEMAETRIKVIQTKSTGIVHSWSLA